MAISYVGVSNAVADATGNFTLVTTGISGLQEGDLLIAFVAMRGSAVVTVPSGWTQVWQDNGGNTSTTASTSIASGLVAYCVRGSSDPNLTFTRSGGDVALGRIIALRGVDTAAPVASWAATVDSSENTFIGTGGVFGDDFEVASTDYYAVMALLGADNTSFSNPWIGIQSTSFASITEQADSNTTTGADTALAIYTSQPDFTISSGDNDYAYAEAAVGSRHGAIILILKDAPPVDALGTPSAIATGTPSVGTPTLGQTHALTATGVSAGAPSVGSPALGQIHALGTPANVATGAPSAGSPAIGQVHALAADGVATDAPSVGSPEIGQVHGLDADGVATDAPSVGTPEIGQVHALASGGVDAGTPTVGAPALSENEAPTDNLSADGIAAGTPSVGSPTLAQIHALTADSITLGTPTVGAPTLTSGEDTQPADTGISGGGRRPSNTSHGGYGSRRLSDREWDEWKDVFRALARDGTVSKRKAKKAAKAAKRIERVVQESGITDPQVDVFADMVAVLEQRAAADRAAIEAMQRRFDLVMRAYREIDEDEAVVAVLMVS